MSSLKPSGPVLAVGQRGCHAARFVRRRGAAAVEAAFVLPILLIMLLGLWEWGRVIQIDQYLKGAAREGARKAAVGWTYKPGTSTTSTGREDVTYDDVKLAVQGHLRACGLPMSVVDAVEVFLTGVDSAEAFTPSTAAPLEKYKVTVRIAGEAYKSLKFTPMTPLVSQSAECVWASSNDKEIGGIDSVNLGPP